MVLNTKYMLNKNRIELIVKEWVKLTTGIELSNDTLSQMVDDIMDVKQCDSQMGTDSMAGDGMNCIECRSTKWANPFRLTPDGFIQCYSTNRKILDPWIMWSCSGGFGMKDVVELYGLWLVGVLQKDHPYLPTPPNIYEAKRIGGLKVIDVYRGNDFADVQIAPIINILHRLF